MKLRLANLEDIGLHMPIIKGILQEGEYKDISTDDELLEKVARNWITDENIFTVVAEDDNNIPMGFMVGQLINLEFSYDLFGRDRVLFIVPDARSKKAGQVLVDTFVKWCFARDVKQVFLSTSTGIEIEAAAAIYKKVGAEKVGETFVVRNGHVRTG